MSKLSSLGPGMLLSVLDEDVFDLKHTQIVHVLLVLLILLGI